MVEEPFTVTSEDAILRLKRGDDKTWKFRYRDSDGDPIDLTGYTFFWAIKDVPSDDTEDSDALYKQTIEPGDLTNPASGDQDFLIDSSSSAQFKPGVYQWEIQLKTPGSRIITPAGGPFHLSADINRRTD
jgi:hypothetical protein